jgi:hypothetical protein
MSVYNISYAPTGNQPTDLRMRQVYRSPDGAVVVNGGDWVTVTVAQESSLTNYCGLLTATIVFAMSLVALLPAPLPLQRQLGWA